MANIHISDLKVTSFQQSLEVAIERAIDSRKIHGGKFSPVIQGKLVNPLLGIGVTRLPITLGITYKPNADLS